MSDVFHYMKLNGVNSAWIVDLEMDPFMEGIEYVTISNNSEVLKRKRVNLGYKLEMPVICFKEENIDQVISVETMPLLRKEGKRFCNCALF